MVGAWQSHFGSCLSPTAHYHADIATEWRFREAVGPIVAIVNPATLVSHPASAIGLAESALPNFALS
jgi:hypothetical protein